MIEGAAETADYIAKGAGWAIEYEEDYARGRGELVALARSGADPDDVVRKMHRVSDSAVDLILWAGQLDPRTSPKITREGVAGAVALLGPGSGRTVEGYMSDSAIVASAVAGLDHAVSSLTYAGESPTADEIESQLPARGLLGPEKDLLESMVRDFSPIAGT